MGNKANVRIINFSFWHLWTTNNPNVLPYMIGLMSSQQYTLLYLEYLYQFPEKARLAFFNLLLFRL